MAIRMAFSRTGRGAPRRRGGDAVCCGPRPNRNETGCLILQKSQKVGQKTEPAATFETPIGRSEVFQKSNLQSRKRNEHFQIQRKWGRFSSPKNVFCCIKKTCPGISDRAPCKCGASTGESVVNNKNRDPHGDVLFYPVRVVQRAQLVIRDRQRVRVWQGWSCIRDRVENWSFGASFRDSSPPEAQNATTKVLPALPAVLPRRPRRFFPSGARSAWCPWTLESAATENPEVSLRDRAAAHPK